jgi:glycosyltransferase involved in cell wall biosynthesis
VFGDEKSELLSNCLIFLAPSRDEGLPITLLEASSYGRCCVASDIPAHREVIEDGITGYLVPRDDKGRFVQKVRDLTAAPTDSIRFIGAAAKKAVVNKFNWETTAQKTEILFEALLNETNTYPKSR